MSQSVLPKISSALQRMTSCLPCKAKTAQVMGGRNGEKQPMLTGDALPPG